MGPNFASTEQIPPAEQSQPSLEAGSSPQFPFPFPGLPSQGQDNPIMAAAMQQVTFRLSPSFQISGCPPCILSLTTSSQVLSLQSGCPPSSSLMQQAQALAQLASLAQLQSMFLMQQQPGVQQQQQQQEVRMTN